jgi:hypothetical protein
LARDFFRGQTVATITDPRVIAWSDQRARTLADATEIFVAKLLAYQADYAAQGIAALITAGGATNLVGDGSVTGPDGRQQVIGNDIGANFIAAVNQMATALNTTLVLGVGITAKAQMDKVQVNGSPR